MDHYQTPRTVIVSVFGKQADKSKSTVKFTEDSVSSLLFFPYFPLSRSGLREAHICSWLVYPSLLDDCGFDLTLFKTLHENLFPSLRTHQPERINLQDPRYKVRDHPRESRRSILAYDFGGFDGVGRELCGSIGVLCRRGKGNYWSEGGSVGRDEQDV